MKALILAIGLLSVTLFSYGQHIYQIRADSVRIYNDCDTAELILENRTQNVPGFLFNKGRGRTEFRKLSFTPIGNGQISVGGMDTLDFGDLLGSSFIRNQYSAPQTGNYWISGNARIDDGLFLTKFKNSENWDSVLTTDEFGNVMMGMPANIYSTSGTLQGNRNVYGDDYNYKMNFLEGAGFFAEGRFEGIDYGIGTYNRPMQNSGVRMNWGKTEIQLNDNVIRFAASQLYTGAYEFLVQGGDNNHPGSTFTERGIVQKLKVGYTNYQTDYPATLDVSGSFKYLDGNQGAGKVLTSNASGVASWQLPGNSVSAIRVLTSNYSATASDYTIINRSTTQFTELTLPFAGANTGKIFILVEDQSNPLNDMTIINAGIKFRGVTYSKVTAVPIGKTNDVSATPIVGYSVTVQSDGTDWIVIK